MPVQINLFPHAPIIGKDVDDEIFLRLSARVARHSIDAIGVLMEERRSCLDAQDSLALALRRDRNLLDNRP